MEDYCENTSVHGVRPIYTAKKTLSRVLWFLIFLSLLGTFCYFLFGIIDKYLSYKVKSVTTHEDQIGLMAFPSVSICNANRVSFKMMREEYGETAEDVAKYYTDAEYCKDHIDYRIAAGYWTGRILNVTNDDKFFVNETCSFNNIKFECDNKNFLRLKHPSYGTCFIFNFDGMKLQSKSGPNYGLKFVVDVEEDDYLPCDFNMNQKPTGVYVSVHEAKTSPDFENFILASPGELTRIGFRKTYTKRLQHPYTDDCRMANDSSKDEYKILTSTSYTLRDCYESCFLFKLWEKCGDLDYKYMYLVQRQFWNLFPSNARKDNFEVCTKKFEEAFYNGTITCKCKKLCDEYNYVTKVNIGKWPPKVRIQKWADKVSIQKGKKVDIDYVKNNIAAIEVFYHTFQTEKNIHSPEYDVGVLLSDLGAYSELFIGISVFSLIEFVMFVVTLCISQLPSKSQSVTPNPRT